MGCRGGGVGQDLGVVLRLVEWNRDGMNLARLEHALTGV